MAEYSGVYGHPYPRVDEYGYPVPPVDEYGNPIVREATDIAPSYGTAATPADYGAAGYGIFGAPHPHDVAASGVVAPDATAYAYEGMVGAGDRIQPEHTTLGETLRRSGSSSSSSEDDGQGGRVRKKKSIKEKIKDKLPGSHKAAEAGAHEKKGIMEKIKEKLPGHH